MGLSRRRFCFSLARLSAMLATPALAAPAHQITPEPLIVSDDIKALENQLQQHTDTFLWEVHNELRHLYGPISEQRSMQHTDIILANSVMDEYMLDILSEWQLEQNLDLALVHLLNKAERYPGLLHLRAACLLKAADVYALQADGVAAQRLYQNVVALGNEHGDRAPGIKPYWALAAYHLRQLGL